MAYWRPPEPGVSVLQPWLEEVVSFLAFHKRGLGYPAHWFLCRLLNDWGLEHQHVNPNGVLHIAGFVTLCQAFLGMELHADLFRRTFSRRALSEEKGKVTRPTLVGRFGL